MVYFEVTNLDRFRIRIRAMCGYCRRLLSQRTYDTRNPKVQTQADEQGNADATAAYAHLKMHALPSVPQDATSGGKENP